MMNHTEAVECVNVLTNYGFEVRRRANDKDEQWVELLKSNGKIQRIFTSVQSVEKFISTSKLGY